MQVSIMPKLHSCPFCFDFWCWYCMRMDTTKSPDVKAVGLQSDRIFVDHEQTSCLHPSFGPKCKALSRVILRANITESTDLCALAYSTAASCSKE